jgi:YebC/PmpR family DNA-binding regulatory protein
MAGHSKWANIQHRKKAQDNKRGKAFTKLIREITVAARLGGDNPDTNPRLRAAIDSGLSQNMKRDVIERAAKRGAGGLEGQDLAEIQYEGYGPSGTAILVSCMTDNKNRTVAEVRHAFTKTGSSLGAEGSVAYLFSKQGLLLFDDINPADKEKLLEAALELAVEDIEENGNSVEISTDATQMTQVKDALIAAGFKPSHAEITMVASTHADITDGHTAEKFIKFIERLEDLDDVQAVYHNANIADDVLSQLS